jgi:hypothetical protein
MRYRSREALVLMLTTISYTLPSVHWYIILGRTLNDTMSQYSTAHNAADAAFKEIRLLLRHGPWGVPGRTTRLAHLLDIIAMEDSPYVFCCLLTLHTDNEVASSDIYLSGVPQPENEFDMSLWQTTVRIHSCPQPKLTIQVI